ncbi:MAG: hypothetical protein HY901_34885 [Deltaproteobacteria bacterium]|nr:hypothetical protein [Deltaproteobacteria bacterium]
MAPEWRCELAGPAEAGKRCGICQTAIGVGESVGRCPRCEATFHDECWKETCGCASYGCELMPKTAKAADPVAPQTFWGQEEKQCSACGKTIKVAALRCRHCGAVFESSTPVEHQAPAPPNGPVSGGVAWAIFAGGVFPPTAPVALMAGGLWALARTDELRRMKPTQRVMAVLGLVAAGVTSVVLLVAGLLLAATH